MDSLFNSLSVIHNKIKSKFTYETDQDQYGTPEKWVMPSVGGSAITGDCEDFALACRQLCREANIPTRLVVCLVAGEGHCVLESSGWILDNNYDRVVSRDELSYEWVAISGFNPRDDWKLITK